MSRPVVMVLAAVTLIAVIAGLAIGLVTFF